MFLCSIPILAGMLARQLAEILQLHKRDLTKSFVMAYLGERWTSDADLKQHLQQCLGQPLPEWRFRWIMHSLVAGHRVRCWVTMERVGQRKVARRLYCLSHYELDRTANERSCITA